ncbi:hypothetical protein J4457_00565 [Candidatus Woesearchaeota archaeon]|nr:hypothetical protein [Candidatus Woesearchaeota archaeon]
MQQTTGLPKGAVPPFGNFLNIPMVVDKALFDEEYMAFNAGSLELSFKMKTKDYKTLVNPEVAEFSIRIL